MSRGAYTLGMGNFDAAMDWAILATGEATDALGPALRDLSEAVEGLRQAGGAPPRRVPVLDAAGPEQNEGRPIIVLNCDSLSDGADRGGYSWRAGPERIEVYGDSYRGLRKGIYDLLTALGVEYPEPGAPPVYPAPQAQGRYAMVRRSGHVPHPAGAVEHTRLFTGGAPLRRRREEDLLRWAARRGCDALAAPPSSRRRRTLERCRRLQLELEPAYPLLARTPSLLRGIRNRELRAMRDGRRRGPSFCPTNPRALALWADACRAFFLAHPGARCYHLWLSPKPAADGPAYPFRCACPSCRAFGPGEQLLMAMNTAADVLAQTDPGALLSYPEEPGEAGSIIPRSNLVKVAVAPR